MTFDIKEEFDKTISPNSITLVYRRLELTRTYRAIKTKDARIPAGVRLYNWILTLEKKITIEPPDRIIITTYTPMYGGVSETLYVKPDTVPQLMTIAKTASTPSDFTKIEVEIRKSASAVSANVKEAWNMFESAILKLADAAYRVPVSKPYEKVNMTYVDRTIATSSDYIIELSMSTLKLTNVFLVCDDCCKCFTRHAEVAKLYIDEDGKVTLWAFPDGVKRIFYLPITYAQELHNIIVNMKNLNDLLNAIGKIENMAERLKNDFQDLLSRLFS